MRGPLFPPLAALTLLASGAPAVAQAGPPRAANSCALYVAEAATRSGLPPQTVLRVMMAESGGNPRIVSPKGAMGCMQIMPATWRYLSARYSLGADPFDARRNMIGGAMYLAELTARYGFAGAIAAYNAGPGRYERYVTGAKSLPAETIAYVQRIGSSRTPTLAAAAPARWQEAALFLDRAAVSEDGRPSATEQPAAPPQTMNRLFPLAPPPQVQTAPAAGP